MIAAGLQNLPKFYRAILVDLVRIVYVDCEPNAVVRMLDPIFLRTTPSRYTAEPDNDLQINGRFDAFPELRPDGSYPDAKRIMIDIMKQHRFDTPDSDSSEFCNAVLSSLALLLQFGKFTHLTDSNGVSTAAYIEGVMGGAANYETMPPGMKENMLELLHAVVGLLDTSRECICFTWRYVNLDCPELAGETDFTVTKYTHPIVQAKLQILDMCMFLFDYRMNARMHCAFATYTSIFTQLEERGELQAHDPIQVFVVYSHWHEFMSR